jgi:hypothetical protein
MTDKLTPKIIKPLLPIFTLLNSARVKAEDIQKANEQWKAEHENEEYQNILEAESE